MYTVRPECQLLNPPVRLGDILRPFTQHSNTTDNVSRHTATAQRGSVGAGAVSHLHSLSHSNSMGPTGLWAEIKSESCPKREMKREMYIDNWLKEHILLLEVTERGHRNVSIREKQVAVRTSSTHAPREPAAPLPGPAATPLRRAPGTGHTFPVTCLPAWGLVSWPVLFSRGVR